MKESKFNIFGSYGQQRVWRKPNKTLKHRIGSVMVWGCMSAKGPGNLHFIEGVMDQHMYLNILK